MLMPSRLWRNGFFYLRAHLSEPLNTKNSLTSQHGKRHDKNIRFTCYSGGY